MVEKSDFFNSLLSDDIKLKSSRSMLQASFEILHKESTKRKITEKDKSSRNLLQRSRKELQSDTI